MRSARGLAWLTADAVLAVGPAGVAIAGDPLLRTAVYLSGARQRDSDRVNERFAVADTDQVEDAVEAQRRE